MHYTSRKAENTQKSRVLLFFCPWLYVVLKGRTMADGNEFHKFPSDEIFTRRWKNSTKRFPANRECMMNLRHAPTSLPCRIKNDVASNQAHSAHEHHSFLTWNIGAKQIRVSVFHYASCETHELIVRVKPVKEADSRRCVGRARVQHMEEAE